MLNRPDAQVVFVDTPGIHKPRTLLGERLNDTAASAVADVDVVLFVIDATATLGTGATVSWPQRLPASRPVRRQQDRRRQPPDDARSAGRPPASSDFDEYFPVSAATGEGVAELVDAVVEPAARGPQLYPDDMVTDVPEAFWVAELVREQLLAVIREEVPHSIACRVTEWEWPRVRCEILVERESQKGIVIGKGGAVLKEVGTRVRRQLARGLPGAVRQGRQGLAEPAQGAGASGLLSAQPGGGAALAERGQEVDHVVPVAGAAHGRQGPDQVPAVAGRGQAGVEHGHHTAVAGRADESPGALSQQGGGPGQVDQAEGGTAETFPPGLQEGFVGSGKRDAVDGHAATAPARGRRRPARSPWWRTGTTARRS